MSRQQKGRKRLRTYYYRAGYWRYLRPAAFCACVLLLCVSVSKLGSYISDYRRSARISAELREAYYASVTSAPAATDAPTAAPTAAPTEAVLLAQAATEAPPAIETAVVNPTPDPLATLSPQTYPRNPAKVISDRFKKLRNQNSDIVGWLSLGELLSEAVVQRDNAYYLRRDYQGYHNVNGAVFLEESCKLDYRPYTLTLYAHNMKSGAMFGCLRNYENLSFYRKNPFISFDTVYEEGRYVIFSVAQVSLDVQSSRYSRFFSLSTCTNVERMDIIERLCQLSKHTCEIDVNLDDQLLLLVTCLDDDSDRRLIAARRVREGESEEALMWQVQGARDR